MSNEFLKSSSRKQIQQVICLNVKWSQGYICTISTMRCQSWHKLKISHRSFKNMKYSWMSMQTSTFFPPGTFSCQPPNMISGWSRGELMWVTTGLLHCVVIGNNDATAPPLDPLCFLTLVYSGTDTDRQNHRVNIAARSSSSPTGVQYKMRQKSTGRRGCRSKYKHTTDIYT